MQFTITIHQSGKQTLIMQLINKTKQIASIGITAAIVMVSIAFTKNELREKAPIAKTSTPKKIQVSVLIDVSNSMDGLIEQTKSQLWTMVNTLGKSTCNNVVPAIEIALYEYGRTNNDAKKGYVKQINSFITSLDSLSENLFKLTTNGGDEYCGEVIYSSIEELPWSTNKEDYKVVFIAGNEDFLQGTRHFSAGCNKAKNKNIIVNTIYCGGYEEGVRLHWNLGAECGNGSYKNINSNAKDVYIATPHDSMLFVYNNMLNYTYVAFGAQAEQMQLKQAQQDALNTTKSRKAGLDRAEAKANAAVYRNDSWDLVDADADGKFDYSKIVKADLPDSLRNYNTAQLKQHVAAKAAERKAIREKITDLSKKRTEYIAEYKKRDAAANNTPTLETEMNNMLRQQAQRFNIIVPN